MVAPNSQSSLAFSHHCCPLADIPRGWASALSRLCVMWQERPSLAQVGMELPLPSRSQGWGRAGGVPLGARSSDFPAGGLEKLQVWTGGGHHTQGVKRLPKPPAATLSSGVLCAGARGHGGEHRLLVGAQEAESRPLRASRRVHLCAGSWRTGRACHPGRLCWMQGTKGAKAQRSQRSGHVLGLGVVGEGDEHGLEGGSNVTGPCLSS